MFVGTAIGGDTCRLEAYGTDDLVVGAEKDALPLLAADLIEECVLGPVPNVLHLEVRGEWGWEVRGESHLSRLTSHVSPLT